ncbi:MAG: hypothetical protein KDC03_24200, partial [Flavobacteriales bacterium]|nr:hypothetical protein [Flavobacteriales bacterium]
MSQQHVLLILATLCLTLASCRKEEEPPTPADPVPIGYDHVIDVQGSVISASGIQLAGATVECNGLAATTDSRGVFRLRDVPVQLGPNFVRVTLSGHFNGGRQFTVLDGEAVSVKVNLLPKALIGSFQASAGGQVSTSDGMSVVIPSNGIANGYQGTVEVYATYIDPTAITGVTPFPGMEAIDANGVEGVLISYGMGHIVLEDGNGNELQLADGTPAQLTIPVPAASQGAAPPSIPLWYFNETEGRWKEEGSAQLQGSDYVGEVAHFSLWNCDDFTCNTSYNVRISCGGEPYAFLPVQIVYNSGFVQGPWDTRLTTSTGHLNFSLPCAGSAELYAFAPGSDDQLLIGTIGCVDGGGEVQHLQMD